MNLNLNNIAISVCFLSSCEWSGTGKYKNWLSEFLGEKVKGVSAEIQKKWYDILDIDTGKKVVFICPETLWWLPTPRIPAEIQPGKTWYDVLDRNAQIINKNNQDVSKYFISWAERSLKILQDNNVWIYVWKNKSPSCGVQTYDGTFSGKLVDIKSGITASLFKKNNVLVLPDSILWKTKEEQWRKISHLLWYWEKQDIQNILHFVESYFNTISKK
jgi:uncharacterized protein YbbK (DUF523 family)